MRQGQSTKRPDKALLFSAAVLLASFGLTPTARAIEGVCVAYCDDYVPQTTDDGGTTRRQNRLYTTPRGTGWYCRARARNGAWAWGESADQVEAQNIAVNQCQNVSKGQSCSITSCSLGGGKNPKQQIGPNETSPFKPMKPSVSQQKKIQAQKQIKHWREQALAENKLCLAEFNKLYSFKGNVDELLKRCRQALDFCKKGRAKCNADEWNVAKALAEQAKRKDDYEEAARQFGILISMCRGDDNCSAVGSKLKGMRSSLLSQKEEMDAKVRFARKAAASKDKMVKAVTSRSHNSTAKVGDGLSFIDAGAPVVSAKANMLLDALKDGNGDWKESIKSLQRQVQENPADQAARDALLYLKGLYEGHMAVSKLNNVRYRRGVHAWMDGDYGKATREFSESYEIDPSDKGALHAYGLVSGLAQSKAEIGSLGDCINTGSCEPLEYVRALARSLGSHSAYRLLNQQQAEKLQRLRMETLTNRNDPEKRAKLAFVEGLAAWDDFRDREKQRSSEIEDVHKVAESYVKLANGDIEGALDIIGEQRWKSDAVSFAYFHALGLENRFGGPRAFRGLWDDRSQKVYQDLYFTRLRAESLQRHNPNARPPWKVIGDRLRAEEIKAWSHFLTDPFEGSSGGGVAAQ